MYLKLLNLYTHNVRLYTHRFCLNLCVYNLTLCVYKFSNFRYKHPAPKRYSGTGLTMRYLIQKRKAPLSTSPAEHHPPHEFQHKKTKRESEPERRTVFLSSSSSHTNRPGGVGTFCEGAGRCCTRDGSPESPLQASNTPDGIAHGRRLRRIP